MFLDAVPAYYPSRFLPVFWTFLINLAFFAGAACLAFASCRQFRRLRHPKVIPYGFLSVAIGIPIDLLFLFLCSKFLTVFNGSRYFSSNDFTYFLNRGFHASYSHIGASFIFAPTVVAVLLLISVQLLLIRYVFFRDLQPSSVARISVIIGVITAPTWATLILLYR
jgi:hypothetical protein